MVGEFIKKFQDARAEFMRGKTPLQVLFSDNPGFIRSTHPVIQRIKSDMDRTPTPIVEKAKSVIENKTGISGATGPVWMPPPTPPVIRTTRPELLPVPIYERVSQARAPTDFFSTLARGFTRVTGGKTTPPAGYRWLY